MASIVISGDTSGAVTLAAPAVAGTPTLTLPTTSGTIVTTAGATTVEFAAGTVSAPAITTTGDTNTGIFFPAADTIAFAEGGAEAARFDASGRLLIGTTSGTRKLTVYENAAQVDLSIVSSTTGLAVIQMGDTAADNQGQIIYRNNGDSMEFAVNGAERMRIDSSGNVGIGTTTPGAPLQARGANVLSASTRYLKGWIGGAGSWGASSFEELGIGYSGIRSLYTSGDNWDLTFATGTSTQFSAGTQAERMRIHSNGYITMGTTNTNIDAGPGFKFIATTNAYIGMVVESSINSQTNYHLYSTGAGTYRFYVGAGGTIYATATTIVAISDVRLKENIQDIDVGLDAIMALKPRKFDWKEGKGKDKKGDRGWIAQEFEQVFPDMIENWKDPAPEGEEPYKAVSADLIPVLVKAIQEQQAIIEELKARIETLEAK